MSPGADDAIDLQIAGHQLNIIRWMKGTKYLMLGTVRAELRGLGWS